MGVIKKDDTRVGTYLTGSAESLNLSIADSGDEDHPVAQGTQVLNGNSTRRSRCRLAPIPTSFCSPKKHCGKKRGRRLENVHHLMTLLEEDELGEPSIDDFIPCQETIFTRLHKDKLLLEGWNEFTYCTEEKQRTLLSHPVRPNSLRQRSHDTMTLTTFCEKEAFMNISGSVRSFLKKKQMPMGMLTNLEDQLLSFFCDSPNGNYISPTLPSFQRLLLHGISQYHSLNANSFNSEPERRVKVSNPKDAFKSPHLWLSQYLQNRWD